MKYTRFELANFRGIERTEVTITSTPIVGERLSQLDDQEIQRSPEYLRPLVDYLRLELPKVRDPDTPEAKKVKRKIAKISGDLIRKFIKLAKNIFSKASAEIVVKLIMSGGQ